MSEHKPEKKAEEIISPAIKIKPGRGKISSDGLSEKELDKASGGGGTQSHGSGGGAGKVS
ncbi:MAG: hypothetical protein ACHQF3_09485 [Alphaproteobacteria bacterium]